MRQILWGLFKKMVIADNCATYVDLIFGNPEEYPGSVLMLGAVFFAFQIYGDFSGYSDIAIGTARLFGFTLMRNFASPYFSRDIAEFWRKWHISLSSWFRDYVYIPLGGSRVNSWTKVRNTFIIFIVSGFWHGANWTFIVWGALNAIYFLPLLLTNKNRVHLGHVAKGRMLPTINELVNMFTTFMLTVFAWIFFRAESIHHATSYIKGMLSESLFTVPVIDENTGKISMIIILIVFQSIMEWLGRNEEYAIAGTGAEWKRPWRWVFYSILIFLIGMYMQTTETPFIYFQF